ncbi:RNA polymerase subunit sigma-24 [Tamlana sedimentorum]|uniref:RNA polymerase subunit sigma-24 n=1 Tax=Neotamlana sedimentorum TaxID=1435349 RepID=A0A0D7WCW6_9FLAO|nr:RNA polymerase sigma-70 factor [Tamlana sedimentorum]KJD36956.1 RNA polymerase subunit sigma-24 [Tamlana sedimentorum]
MHRTDDDILLLKQFKSGNERTFEHFFNKYYNHIVGFCIQFVYNENEAKNITQEAFVNLWLNKEKIDSLNGIKSFLYTYSKSKCLNAIRHQKVKEKYKNQTLNDKEKQLNIEVLNAMKFDTMSLTELENLITQSVYELPDKTQEIFIKKRFENKKNKEIALELNISIKTVEAHITKALNILKTKLSDYLPSILIAFLLF